MVMLGRKLQYMRQQVSVVGNTMAVQSQGYNCDVWTYSVSGKQELMFQRIKFNIVPFPKRERMKKMLQKIMWDEILFPVEERMKMYHVMFLLPKEVAAEC